MISLTCTNCKQVLSIDDAFAGGVCRCQYCGTIQTVPSKLKGKSSSKPASAKTLYQKTAGGGTPGTGLDDLADIVASSGLAGSGLGSRRLGSHAVAKETRRSPVFLASLVGGTLLVALLLGIIVWLLMRNDGGGAGGGTQGQHATNPPGAVTGEKPGAPAAVAGPNFCGLKLETPSVAYVLDRGQATGEWFDALKAATYKSIASLGPERKFAVIFWGSGGEVSAYPETEMNFATKDQVATCMKKLEDVTAFGSTDPVGALEQAASRKPATIVLVTAKGGDLPPETVASALAALKGESIIIHTVALGDAESPVLGELAAKTNGTTRAVSGPQLRKFAE